MAGQRRSARRARQSQSVAPTAGRSRPAAALQPPQPARRWCSTPTHLGRSCGLQVVVHQERVDAAIHTGCLRPDAKANEPLQQAAIQHADLGRGWRAAQKHAAQQATRPSSSYRRKEGAARGKAHTLAGPTGLGPGSNDTAAWQHRQRQAHLYTTTARDWSAGGRVSHKTELAALRTNRKCSGSTSCTCAAAAATADAYAASTAGSYESTRLTSLPARDCS